MSAMVQDSYGSADVLRMSRIPRPKITDTQVLIKVQAAGVDRGALHLMTGKPYLVRLATGLRRPKTRSAGREVAGTVVEVGSAVTRFAIGNEVFGSAEGTFAEYAAGREDTSSPTNRPMSPSSRQQRCRSQRRGVQPPCWILGQRFQVCVADLEHIDLHDSRLSGDAYPRGSASGGSARDQQLELAWVVTSAAVHGVDVACRPMWPTDAAQDSKATDKRRLSAGGTGNYGHGIEEAGHLAALQ